MFTTYEPTLDIEVRDQRERLAGLTTARRTKFRVLRRWHLTLPTQPRKTTVEA